MKIAGAPISWGVCEVPDWGYQMTPERVLTEMRQIGLTATEFGPQGWLPVDAEERAAVVNQYGLKPVGAVFLAVMHDPEFDPIPQVEQELKAFEVAGGEFLVLAADSGRDGYDDRPVLDDLNVHARRQCRGHDDDHRAGRGGQQPGRAHREQQPDSGGRQLDLAFVGVRCYRPGHDRVDGSADDPARGDPDRCRRPVRPWRPSPSRLATRTSVIDLRVR